jgi:hypothetical protein
LGGFDYCLDTVIANTRRRYDFPLILGRTFFAQGGLMLDGEQGKTTIRTSRLYEVFVVTYPENDASQTPEWKLFKKAVDDYAQRKLKEEEARGYPSDEDCNSPFFARFILLFNYACYVCSYVINCLCVYFGLGFVESGVRRVF